MAEKIDKNEYVDNSKVFFDFLLHTHQWSNITPVEYAKWLSNFNTYLSVELCKELFSYFAAISTRKNIIGDVEYQKIQKAYNRSVRTTPANNLLCFEDLIDDCDNILNAIEDCINYGEQIADSLIFRITSAGSIFKSVVEEILKLAHFSDVTFRVFIDEFESLCEWQQHLCVMMVDLLLTVKKRQNRRMISSYQIPLLARSQKRRKNIGKQGMFLPQANDMKQNCYGRI